MTPRSIGSPRTSMTTRGGISVIFMEGGKGCQASRIRLLTGELSLVRQIKRGKHGEGTFEWMESLADVANGVVRISNDSRGSQGNSKSASSRCLSSLTFRL